MNRFKALPVGAGFMGSYHASSRIDEPRGDWCFDLRELKKLHLYNPTIEGENNEATRNPLYLTVD
jgi:hypothetical protein